MTPLLTVKAVRERLGLGQGAAYGLIASGSIPSLRVGLGSRSIRVREEDLESWIASRVEGADHQDERTVRRIQPLTVRNGGQANGHRRRTA